MKFFCLENEPIIQNHPLSCYTSKRIDYSAKLNEILSQKELSSKIIIDNEEDEEDNYAMLSKDLGKLYKFLFTFFYYLNLMVVLSYSLTVQTPRCFRPTTHRTSRASSPTGYTARW
jgi:hypothetical protein